MDQLALNVLGDFHQKSLNPQARHHRKRAVPSAVGGPAPSAVPAAAGGPEPAAAASSVPAAAGSSELAAAPPAN